jgi:hypothetical protein
MAAERQVRDQLSRRGLYRARLLNTLSLARGRNCPDLSLVPPLLSPDLVGALGANPRLLTVGCLARFVLRRPNEELSDGLGQEVPDGRDKSRMAGRAPRSRSVGRKDQRQAG